jgi:hypothetical protein
MTCMLTIPHSNKSSTDHMTCMLTISHSNNSSTDRNPVRLTAKVNSTIANAGVVQSTYPSPINIKAGTILPVKINFQLIQ